MQINISADANALGRAAGTAAAALTREAIASKGSANMILATGTSQFATLQQLLSEEGIDWGSVVMFHLDEYIGLPITHPASFRRYLVERFIEKAPSLKVFYLINGEGDVQEECKRLGQQIAQHPIDVALIGIGENGHIAFNDPPADFETEEPFIVVELDEACRQQQLGEGWFGSIGEVPRKAISMSIRQIMKSKHIVCSVPDARKATAVKNTIQQQVSELYPSTILQQHPDCTLYLDKASASLLSESVESNRN